jgi:hypothetical protein
MAYLVAPDDALVGSCIASMSTSSLYTPKPFTHPSKPESTSHLWPSKIRRPPLVMMVTGDEVNDWETWVPHLLLFNPLQPTFHCSIMRPRSFRPNRRSILIPPPLFQQRTSKQSLQHPLVPIAGPDTTLAHSVGIAQILSLIKRVTTIVYSAAAASTIISGARAFAKLRHWTSFRHAEFVVGSIVKVASDSAILQRRKYD